MKWLRAFSALPALVSAIIAAIQAYDTGAPDVDKRLVVEAAAQALREIIAQFYTRTPSPERVSAIVARVMGALENTK